MTEKANGGFYKICVLENKIALSGDGLEAQILQVVEIESERAATLFISQLLDDIEIFESARYLVEKGRTRLELRKMRVVRPRLMNSDGSPFYYKIGVGVFSPGCDMTDESEMRHLGTPES